MRAYSPLHSAGRASSQLPWLAEMLHSSGNIGWETGDPRAIRAEEQVPYFGPRSNICAY